VKSFKTFESFDTILHSVSLIIQETINFFPNWNFIFYTTNQYRQ